MNNKQIGNELEEFVSNLIKEMDSSARPQPGSGNGLRKGDISNNLGFCIECKNSINFQWKDAVRQVKRESMGYQKEVIVWHPTQEGAPLDDSLVIVNIHTFIDLLRAGHDSMTKGDILDKFQVKKHLESAVFHLRQIKNDL